MRTPSHIYRGFFLLSPFPFLLVDSYCIFSSACHVDDRAQYITDERRERTEDETHALDALVGPTGRGARAGLFVGYEPTRRK